MLADVRGEVLEPAAVPDGGGTDGYVLFTDTMVDPTITKRKKKKKNGYDSVRIVRL